MTSIGLGKVTVATAGIPTLLSTLTTLIKVHRIIVSADPADTTAYVYIKDKSGNIYAATSLNGGPIIIGGDESNQVVVANYQIDASANGKGPIVGLDIA
jgi:hypothetical protein